MTDFKLKLTPEKRGIPMGYPSELHVLLRLQGPAAPPQGGVREKLNLALVLDRSGSMNGRPLSEAIKCADFVINSLAPNDLASLVVYDNDVDVLVPTCEVGDGQAFRSALSMLSSGGMTALFNGWKQGGQMARMGVERASVNRVLLLSDGMANVGLVETDQIADFCAEYAGKGVTTSTYGLGYSFNEELMLAMARSGCGNSYYGETADDLMDPFREEFDLLTAVSARNVRLKVEVPDGVRLDILNNFKLDSEGAWILPDLAYGGETWALARLRFDDSASLATRNMVQLLEAKLSFDSVEGNRTDSLCVGLELPVMTAGRWRDLPVDEKVRTRQRELEFAELQEQARSAAYAGDWHQVDALLAKSKEASGDNAWLLQSLKTLRDYASRRETQRFSKEVSYKSNRLRSRMLDPMEDVLNYSADVESQKPSFLRRKESQGKKHSQ